MREIPLREKRPKRKVEEDAAARAASASLLRPPEGSAEFKEGFRECVELFTLHRPNKRGLARVLAEHSIILENACMAAMTRENLAKYEGFREALKQLKQHGLVKH